ncbi:DUF6460 domain-containing protein [Hyphobacterium sp. HN65]|uniref:DUF6460 domain-containing protein n=1 Tax=Hyphobacterium lacteum TaxID=3116575 RepID=A0ABU7LNF0_9PROT|nr:DUF6460 domain-containing protein [Hyphobacterium sp. HN65]MEE2525418.1 DUF6460 domain-containing protein [Hyphobacterium sp. HN65]
MSETGNTPSDETREREPKSRVQRLLSITPGDLVRVALISVIVGLVLAAFRVDPRRLWVDFFGTIAEAWSEFINISMDLVRWSVDYLFLGAVLVVPIWLVIHIVRSLGKRSP